MLIRTELAALRGDDTPQRSAQQRLRGVVEQWRAGPACPGLDDAVASYARGAALADLPPLARLFTRGDPAATRLVGSLIGVLTHELGVDPWGQVPLRHQADATTATLVLARHGSTALVLQATNGAGLARRKPALTAGFTPGETHEHVLAGSATARAITLVSERPGGAELQFAACALSAGTVNRRDGAHQALLIEGVAETLVTLKLQRRPLSGALTCEFNLSDGAFVHQASAAARESRLELTAALLGRMGRRDAAPLLAAMAEEQAGLSLRWQSLKECLGLDSGAGFATLSRIAASSADPLAVPAGALRAQLLERHPELAGVAACPG